QHRFQAAKIRWTRFPWSSFVGNPAPPGFAACNIQRFDGLRKKRRICPADAELSRSNLLRIALRERLLEFFDPMWIKHRGFPALRPKMKLTHLQETLNIRGRHFVSVGIRESHFERKPVSATPAD